MLPGPRLASELTVYPVLMSHELNLAPMLALIAGGPALFRFGLELMTASLKAVAGPGLQTELSKLTANVFEGCWPALFVTAILAVGFLLRASGRHEALRHLGSVLLGFRLLFLGIQFMGDGARDYL
jgi:Na+/phosphate symporter